MSIENVVRRPQSDFVELSHLTEEEAAEVVRVFEESGIDFALFESNLGSYALFLDKYGELQGIDAGIFLQCIGVYFGNEALDADTQRHQHDQLSAIIREEDPSVSLPAYSRLLLHGIVQTLSWRTLVEHSELSHGEAELVRSIAQIHNTVLRPYFDSNNQEIRGFYFADAANVPQAIDTQAYGLVAGFLLPQSNRRKNRYWLNALQTDYQRYTGHWATFLHPTRDQLQPLIDEWSQQNDPTAQEYGFRPPSQVEQERLLFRNAAQRYLSDILHPYGIDVVDAKLLATNGEYSHREIFDRATIVNQFPTADLIFVKKDPSTIELAPINLRGFKAPKNKNEPPSEFIPYGGVCGIVLVENESPLTDRKRLMRTAAGELRRYIPSMQPHSASHPMVVTLDPNLFEAWQNHGPLVDEAELRETIATTEPKKLRDYNLYVQSKHQPFVQLHGFEPGHSRIGGTQLFLTRELDPSWNDVVILDFGYMFDQVPAWSPLGRQPSYVDGIAPFLENQMFPMVPRLYRSDLIEQSVSSGTLSRIEQNSRALSGKNGFSNVDEFLLLEVLHRFGEDGLMNILRENAPAMTTQLLRNNKIKRVLNHLKKREQHVYSKKRFYHGLALTHAHQDHAIGSAFVRDEVVRAWSAVTRALLMADHRTSSTWFVQDTAVRKMRERDKIGSSYPVFEYPSLHLEDGKSIEIAPEIYLTPIEVYHSIPGSMGFFLEVRHHGERVSTLLYPGDYRDGTVFQRAGELGGADLVIMEATNPPSSKKKSKQVTEADVKERIDEEVAHATEAELAVVIDLVKSGFERLSNIMDIAFARGRTVVLSPKIIEKIRSIQMLVKPDTRASMLYGNIPFISPGDDRIRVWKPPKGSYSTAEKDAAALYRPVTPEDVAANPQHYIVIRENEQPEKLLGIGNKVLWIDSTYAAYTEEARQVKKYQEKFAREHGYIFVNEGVHATGHNSVLRAEDDPDGTGVLSQIHLAHPKMIHILHTQRRGEVARGVLGNYPQLRDVRVIQRVSHPWYTIPLVR